MRRPPILPLAAAVAVATATVAIAVPAWAPNLPLPFRLEPLRAADLGIEWSNQAVSPDQLRVAALRQLLRVLAVVTGLAAAISVGAFTLLMTGRALGRRREMAVRGALGAHGRPLIDLLVRESGPSLAAGAAVGAVVGAAGLVLMGVTWPGAQTTLLPRLPTAMGLVVALGVLLITVPLVLLPARYAQGSLAPLLAAGQRTTPDRHEGGGRRLLIGTQMAAALALLAGGLTVIQTGNRELSPEPGTGGRKDLLIVPLAVTSDAAGPASRDWSRLTDKVAALQGVTRESLASPGAWVGLGTEDFALAHCGECLRGGLIVRLLGAMVHHHAVSPSFFDSAGLAVLDGRGLSLADGPSAPAVAVISRSFAASYFENGKPVGRSVRLGRFHERWYRVIGVVEDTTEPALGRSNLPTPAVYLSLSQHPPDRADLAVRLAPGADRDSVARAAAETGFRIAGPSRMAVDYLDSYAAPLRWWGAAVSIVALLALILAVGSTHEMARLDGEARRQEVAVRRALGASQFRVVSHALGRVARISIIAAFWALPGAVGVSAAVQHVAAGVPLFNVRIYVGLALLLTGAVMLGALRPALTASRVEPAEALAE